MESNLRCGQRPRLGYSLSVFGLSAPPILTMRCCIRTVYASFINTMNGNGLTDNSNSSDLLLDGIIFIAFLVGVGCGWSKLGTNCGPVLLGACGGLAFAFMALLLRPGLLFGSFYFANWLLAGPLGAAGAAYTIFRQKFGVVRPTLSPLHRFLNIRSRSSDPRRVARSYLSSQSTSPSTNNPG